MKVPKYFGHLLKIPLFLTLSFIGMSLREYSGRSMDALIFNVQYRDLIGICFIVITLNALLDFVIESFTTKRESKNEKTV